MKNILIIAFVLIHISVMSQEENKSLPYYEVPSYANKDYTAGTVAARMVDALGFRFYWATEKLTEKDLSFKPNSESRTTEETVAHIYDLSKIIVNSALGKTNERKKENLSYEAMRQGTLNNLLAASEVLSGSQNIGEYTIKFGNQEFPFWNQINGPIADAIWHCGQIAINRRNSGNPMNSKINHFLGRIQD